MEFRKHYSDFSTKEEKLLKIHLGKDYKLSHHTLNRCKTKNITKEEIDRAIHNGKIIEFHYKDSNRILIRGNIKESNFNICVVVDIDKREVVTAWKNCHKDNHSTLDGSKYIPHINICNLISLN